MASQSTALSFWRCMLTGSRFDLIDEVDFWSQGVEEEDQVPSGLGPNDPQAAGMEGALANGELKIMQEDE